jgi:hypothetical protein
MPPLEKRTPLAVPPDATSRVPPLIAVARADPPELTISPPLKMSVPLDRPSRDSISWPLKSTVPEVVPPDETISVPVFNTVPIAVARAAGDAGVLPHAAPRKMDRISTQGNRGCGLFRTTRSPESHRAPA